MGQMNLATSGAVLLMTMALAACGGGGGGGDASGPIGSDSIDNGQRPAAPSPTLEYGIKLLRFSWPAVDGATHYRLYENADGASGYSQVGGDITATQVEHSIALYNRVNANYLVSACNSGGCRDSAPVSLSAHLVEAVGKLQSSNTESGDAFGSAIALSADGNTLAVGAFREDSGIIGQEADNSAQNAGAVYVLVRNGGSWVQQAYIKASNPGAGDLFGAAVSLSGSGNTLVVGAPYENSNARVIGGDESNNAADNAGAVYVFTRNGSHWTQQAYVKASNADAQDRFGAAVSLAHDGKSFAVGAPWEGSDAARVNGNQDSNAIPGAGAVYLFGYDENGWRQTAYVKASNAEALDYFGYAVQLSGDGNTLAVGAPREDSRDSGVNRSQSNAAVGQDYGAVYVFARGDNGVWGQQAYVKGARPEGRAFENEHEPWADHFGYAVSLSFDGNTLAVGAPYENGLPSPSDGRVYATEGGAVYLYSRTGTSWQQQAYLRSPNNTFEGLLVIQSLRFGFALQLSADGNTLVVGSIGDNTLSTGVNGDQTLTGALQIFHGAAYVFTRNADLWSEHAYLKPTDPDSSTSFGGNVAISSDGDTVAVAGRLGTPRNIVLQLDILDWGLEGAVYLY